MGNVKLLPLPRAWERRNYKDDMADYAKANVAHATATLHAEIERLRRDRDDCLAAREHYAGLFAEHYGRADIAESQRDILIEACEDVLAAGSDSQLRAATNAMTDALARASQPPAMLTAAKGDV